MTMKSSFVRSDGVCRDRCQQPVTMRKRVARILARDHYVPNLKISSPADVVVFINCQAIWSVSYATIIFVKIRTE